MHKLFCMIFGVLLIPDTSHASTGFLELGHGQCQMAVADLDTGFVPSISLNETPLRVGNDFIPGVILSSRTENGFGLKTDVRLQLFEDEQGLPNLDAIIDLTYDSSDQTLMTKKQAHFRMLMSKDYRVNDFQEKLSYSVQDRTSKRFLNVPGKSRFDGALRSVHQTVSQKDGILEVERITGTKIKMYLACTFPKKSGPASH